MKMKNLLLGALFFFSGVAQAQMMPPIPLDTAVRIGTLDNGLTYYIRYNNWPENRANFYIAQKVGSIQEEESQRGLAHFLEHMAFNGSDNFKGNNLIEYLRSIGVEFGRDLNAYTSIDRTVYNIDNVPTTRQSALDSCMLILRDWSCGLSLEGEEIDKERGVIHEEWRLRTSASSRMLERNLEKLYPGSKYGKRYPIGLMSVVDNFKYNELRDYYHKWYHPSNQGIIVVGDVDLDHTEAMIKKLFGGIKNPENAAPVVSEQVPDNDKPIVIIDKDKEYQTSDISVMFKHDVFPDSLKSNLSYYVYDYMKSAFSYMINQRYNEAAQQEGCPFVSASAYDANYIFSKTKDALTIDVSPKTPEQMEEALTAAIVETRRASEFGFTPTEYIRFQESYNSQLDKQLSNKDKRFTSQFYRECVNHFLANEPMAPIEFEVQTLKQLASMVPVQAINEYARELLPSNDSNLVVVNFNNDKEGAYIPTEEGLLKAIADARAAKVEAYVDNVKNEPLITTLPTPGKIVKETKNDVLGYTKLTLSNGISVILKKTDFKHDEVILAGRGDGGYGLYDVKEATNAHLFNSVIGISGLGNFSSTELTKALAGKIANCDLSMGETSMGLKGTSTPKDVETMLQMAYLYMTNIKKDEKSFANLLSQLELSLKNRAISPEVAFSDSLSMTLYDHNRWAKNLELDDLKDINYDRILAMAKERTANANGWTFRILGNFDEATIRPLICQYLGALPAKKGKVVKNINVMEMAKKGAENIFERKMETPKANCYMIWNNTKMAYTPANIIKADAAGEILSMIYLQKIREDAGAAYSCGAQGSVSISEDKLGAHPRVTFIAYCPMKPEKKDLAMQIMREEVENLTKSCDATMLQKVKEVMLKKLADSQKSNSYWSGRINLLDRFGIDTHTDFAKTIENLKPEDITAFMSEFVKDDVRFTVAMLPAEDK